MSANACFGLSGSLGDFHFSTGDDTDLAMVETIVIWMEDYFKAPGAALENASVDVDLDALQ